MFGIYIYIDSLLPGSFTARVSVTSRMTHILLPCFEASLGIPNPKQQTSRHRWVHQGFTLLVKPGFGGFDSGPNLQIVGYLYDNYRGSTSNRNLLKCFQHKGWMVEFLQFFWGWELQEPLNEDQARNTQQMCRWREAKSPE